ncbi:DNA-binding transcriptional regulator, LacI/PurR family [Pseudarcicella hirudinis]|uniref:DNA-binding transcriptional regulator, LacI/PurR family n=1 Tax=Pseudarcicella hirudinis TaxID=1079859 RepID=A0A1I5P9U9_9BACT|nr:LacI family DNA-binding transcriptional regulator [Pseudarcicella hirudinis]SFP30246.1 DNA-binding transcriptional regulator, LacI/PurR family [Pseudarcicella hirudinis]
MSTNPTMKEIAKELGTSVSTVSRALQNHPRIGLRMKERVKELALKLNYVPNSTAIHLKKKRNYNIGIVLPYLTEQFFSLAITGIEDILFEKGYRALVVQSRNDYEREKQSITSLIQHGVDGIIVSVASETYNYSHFNELNSHGIPIVFFDRVVKILPNSCVYGDIAIGAFEAVEYLISQGMTKIALLNGPSTLIASDERLTGYIKALKKHDAQININYIKSVDLSKEDTIRKTHELLNLEEPPQAVLAFHDYVALDSMQICRERGFAINKDIFFVSFSNLSFCSYLEQPPIASVEQFPYEMGEKAAKILIKAIEHPADYIRQEIIIKSKLVIR